MKKDDKENIQIPLLKLGVDVLKKGTMNISSAKESKEVSPMAEEGQGVNPKKNASSGSSEKAKNAEKQIETSPSTKEERQEFFIPVSGFVWLYPEEVSVVNHPAFQRLGNIYQLGHTFLVYRGATHKRLEHAIGTLHVVQRMIDAVNHNCDKDNKKYYRKRSDGDYGIKIKPNEERFIRLGALLHDIGHIAFGHTIEDELCLIDKHDSDSRLNLIFKDEAETWVDADRKPLGSLIDNEFKKYVPDDLKDINASTIVHLMISKPPKENEKDELESVRARIKKSSSVRLEICRDMIGNTICADILDYIHRDWYHIGKPKIFDERILQYMEVASDKKDAREYPVADSEDKFVIMIGKRPKIRTDAISAILELLEWRYHIAESVLFHRTKLAAAAMLDRALYELWKDETGKDIEKRILPLSEEQLLSTCLAEARLMKKKGEGQKKKADAAERLLLALKNRQLYTNLCTYSFDELSPDIRSKIRDQYAKSPEGRNVAPDFRIKALKTLEEDFNITPRGSIVMYCPTEGMNAKIAEVKIKVHDIVKQFNDYEQCNNNQLSGGHLDAQLKRYERLWRVHFFIDRKVKKELEDNKLLEALLLTIDKLVLNNLKDGETYQNVVKTLFALMATNERSPIYEKVLNDEILNTKAASGINIEGYAFGSPSLRSCIKKDKDVDPE